MKELLQILYKNNRRDFEVWNYLWLFSENDTISFTLTELSARLSIPKTSLHRILHSYIEKWNVNKLFVELKKDSNKRVVITFYPKGKKIPKGQIHTIQEQLYDWLKDYYSDLDFDYTDLPKHKKYITTLCNKLKKAMAKRNTEITDETLVDTFKYFFINIPDWWKENQNITLTLISKHFTKILNQVKANGNGNSKKRDSYSKAAEKVDEVDFSQFAEKQKEVS